ncbi:hypothetical protein AB0C84_40455 [Actinomadura sp. NPDC048955]|uniref:hypothetical protein n=1 Tax=Actinomadura sp. NPDC048955 TaxID=3158228 RepID=UPI0033CAB7AE
MNHHPSVPNASAPLSRPALPPLLASAQRTVAQQVRERRAVAAERDPHRQDAHRARLDATIETNRQAWSAAVIGKRPARFDLGEALRVWSQTVPFVDDSAEAHALTELCEGRLRELHPTGMGHYDLLCEAGLHPADAMAGAAPLFDHSPGIRPDPVAGVAEADALAWAWTQDGPTREMILDLVAEQHGATMVHRMQQVATAADPSPFEAAELRAALRRNTDLADETIDRILARQSAEQKSPPRWPNATAAHAADPSDTSPTTRTRAAARAASGRAIPLLSPARTVAADFPHTALHAVRHVRRYGRRGPAPVTGPAMRRPRGERGVA